MGNRTEHGSGTVVGGGSAAPSGTTALLPFNYRLAENDTRRISASGSCSGSRGRKYRTKRYYRSAERYYRPERYYRTTTIQLPDNNKTMPEEKPTSGTRCGRPQRYYRISGTTMVPSGTTAWVTGKLPRQADKTINPELPQLLQMSSDWL